MLSLVSQKGQIIFDTYEYAGIVDLAHTINIEPVSKLIAVAHISPTIIEKNGVETVVNCVKVVLNYSLPSRRRGGIEQVGATISLCYREGNRTYTLCSQDVVIDQRPNDFRQFEASQIQWRINPETLSIVGEDLNSPLQTKTGEEFTVSRVVLEFPYRVLRVYVKNTGGFPKRNFTQITENQKHILYESVARH